QVGMSAPEFTFTDRDGNRRTFAPDSSEVTLIYFFDTECGDCHLARTRLDADIPTTRYIDAGLVRVVAISAEEPTDEWREKVKKFPSTWTVGSAPDIDTIYDITVTPSFYILDENAVIRMKNAGIDAVLQVMSRL
ncbi:MAG: redoxin domain-containing protein, partial [Paramuribaculum sp.]|nr:redoxin domain-containing protein [Paramuribaculum sp.]